MQKTCFERYLEESIKKFNQFKGHSMTGKELMEHFFPRKIARLVNSFVPNSERKNAIILVGPSCSGKTTFARKFVEENPEFVLVSMDQCSAEDIQEIGFFGLLRMSLGADSHSIDDFGNRRFGQMLEKKHSNIIIDGNWMHVNSRGALLRTLTDLGYHTCIMLIAVDQNTYGKKVKNRCLEMIAARRINEDPTQLLDGVDLIKAYADYIGFSVEDAKALIEKSDEYLEFYMNEWKMLEAEYEDSCFESQLIGHIVFIGADELMVAKF